MSEEQPEPSKRDVLAVAQVMYAESPHKTTWNWHAAQAKTHRKWLDAARHALIAVQRNHPAAAESVVEDLEGALREAERLLGMGLTDAMYGMDRPETPWPYVEDFLRRYDPASPLHGKFASLPSPEPTQLDAVSFVGEGDPDRPFPPPLVARWLLHRSVPANDLVDELDYWAHRMAGGTDETFHRRARTIDEAMR